MSAVATSPIVAPMPSVNRLSRLKHCDQPLPSMSLATAEEALSFVSPADRDTWVRMGRALYDEFGEDAFTAWDNWSQRYANYNAKAARATWKSCKKPGRGGKPVTIATVLYLAKEGGFKFRTEHKANFTEEELERANAAREARRAAALAEEAILEEAAAIRARDIWEAAELATEHAYLTRKGVQPHGTKFAPVWTKQWVDRETGEIREIHHKDALLVPISIGPCQLVSLQAIFPKPTVGPRDDKRDKDYLTNGRKHGGYFAIGAITRETATVIVCEGFATGASLHQATGHPVLTAFDTSNLAAVSASIRAKLPNVRLVLAADNDQFNKPRANGQPHNPGLEAATEAAKACGGLVALPVFADLEGQPTDFNDLMLREGVEAVRATIEAAAAPVEAALPAPALPPTAKLSAERPVILFVPGELHRVVDCAEAALVNHAHDLFVRAGQIVRPVREHVEASHGHRAPVFRLHPLNKHALVEALTAAADWSKPDARRKDGEMSRINAPLQVADTLLARGQFRLRPLTAIINSPTLRRDGTSIEIAGYDSETGLLLELNAKFGPVPHCPSQDDARAALDRLTGLVSEFPFVRPQDCAVWLAAVLTACIRRSLPSAPMFAFTAPTAGTGKSLLVDLCAVIATGSRAPVFAQGRGEEESEKRLASALLAGHGVITIDNCTLAIDGDLLCQAMTQPELNIRPLGGSTVRTVPTSATFFATGNCLVIAGDMTRRTLLCSLDPGEERPELRRFSFDPIERAETNRASFLIDALTILRAFHVAGRPTQQVARLGSFEAWSDLVRGALVWLDVDDPVSTMEKTRKADPKLAALRNVLAEWSVAFGSRQVRVREMIDAALELDPTAGGFGPRQAYRRPDFREALLVVAGTSGSINGRSLGMWLAANRDRIVDGRRLQQLGNDRNGVALWCVEETSQF